MTNQLTTERPQSQRESWSLRLRLMKPSTHGDDVAALWNGGPRRNYRAAAQYRVGQVAPAMPAFVGSPYEKRTRTLKRGSIVAANSESHDRSLSPPRSGPQISALAGDTRQRRVENLHANLPSQRQRTSWWPASPVSLPGGRLFCAAPLADRDLPSPSIPPRLHHRLREARGIGEAQFVAAGYLNEAKQAELLRQTRVPR